MIYLFRNYQSSDIEKYAEYLPAERTEKLNRLRQKRDRENCVISYLILKYALSKYGLESFQLETGEHGKPYLKGQDIHFNISHCKLGVAVAVSTSPVGIDIQDIGEFNEKVMNRVCSDEEKDIILSSSDSAREFTRIWTLKESAAKYDGKGIQLLNSFSFDSTEKRFTKYGKSFNTFEFDKFFVSACGSDEFSDIIEINNLEDLL